MTCRWSSWYKLYSTGTCTSEYKQTIGIGQDLCLLVSCIVGRSLGFVHFFTGKYTIETEYS